MITYKFHPIDGNFDYMGVDSSQNIIFEGFLLGGKISWVDVYSPKGKWRGKKIACFSSIRYKK